LPEKDIVAAEKFESDNVKCKSDFVPGSGRMAELFTSLGRAKRRKKKSKPQLKATSKIVK